jgi:hypothetical protein
MKQMRKRLKQSPEINLLRASTLRSRHTARALRDEDVMQSFGFRVNAQRYHPE